MTRIGYARVSTFDQNLDSQLDELKKAGCTKIFQEKASSAKKRPEFEKCLDYLREDDTLVVWKLDRLGRTTKKLLELIDDEKVSIERVDDAVSRILTVKFKLGLFEEPFTNRDLLPEIGKAAHREIARNAVRESLVLLKNDSSVLPISKSSSRIMISGKNADNLGHQMGGWSIYWQGGSGDITEGTSILEGIREVFTNDVDYNINGNGASGADVAVAVIGETPYAEGAGDKTDLSLSSTDINLVKSLKSQGVPVVVVLISGRPLILDPILDDADAVIAAWLPGTEGIGVADVLFGDYNPTGKLSVSWPRSNAQIPINVGDTDYDPLFEYGFGLSY